ncbi:MULTISPECIES: hypothetical protein [Flavobacteriaceae]|uniref:PKD domain-containing protein n=2 Tax=Flavobacteriaceae TaxID=49546 RepID=A0A4Y8APE9_9FLAO|nr:MULTISPECIES: hypothetical protein [Flavobacteriaceae]TEW72500.1 hypothetical protein E2488_13690 [Gramella jeungdoensis]GGK55237.1 hypothetical protein GCM10007963_24420 [Lutibacter litoralis]
MKTLKYILSFALIFFISCSDDLNDVNFVDNIQAPANVSAQFLIKQDNTGLVTISPNSEGGVSYDVTFGDGSSDVVSLNQGESVQRTYAEGTYPIGIEAIGITGLKTAATQDLVVSFRAPENIVIKAAIDGANPFVMNVSATADFATSFLVYFDTSNVDEEPTPLGLDGTVSFEYPSVGDFTIKVVALSGGTATSELTQTVTISSPVELPIEFEIFDASVFQGFGGASNAVIDNPDTNGNNSSKVGQIVKGAPEVWAGNVITLSAPIDFSTKNAIKMDVWSPRAGGKVLLKLENLDDGGIFYEVEATTLGNSAWETVTFDVSGIDLSNTYQKVVLFFDIGTAGDGSADWTFYIDNIKQDFLSEGAFAKVTVEDFEGAAELFPFGNATAEVITLNDLPSGLGIVTDNVAQFTKTNGAEVWAGVTRELDMPLDLATYTNISLKTWSPKVGAVVKVKLENADASITHEIDVNTTRSNAWEVLEYDFSGAPAADYVKVVVFFDFGVSGDDSVYYYDNIELFNNGTPPTVFEDFEGTAELLPFGNASAGVITLDDLPSGLGIVTANVAQFTKTSGAEVWAGVTRELDAALDLDTYNKISLKTWSSKVGAVVKVKLENADASITHEVDVNTTISGDWEVLEYDFSGAPAADYVKVVVFFDFGVVGDDSVYYFDDYTLTN